jgi:hypothetical protein
MENKGCIMAVIITVGIFLMMIFGITIENSNIVPIVHIIIIILMVGIGYMVYRTGGKGEQEKVIKERFFINDSNKPVNDKDEIKKDNSEKEKDTSTMIFNLNEKKVTMKTVSKNLHFEIAGIGNMSIDWNDGSKLEQFIFSADIVVEINHLYAFDKERIITIYGDILYLDCTCNDLTYLDVSKSTSLTDLLCCGNCLTKLDLSKNTMLTDVYCESNDFSGTSLNALFRTLPVHNASDLCFILIRDNPGVYQCDESIAEKKGWEVHVQ